MATICIGLVLFECKLLNKILNSLFLVYQIEFVGDFFGWGLGEETDDDVCCDGHQEGGKEFIDSQAPPSLLIPYFQMNTMDPPQIIPARAPCQLERLQNNARRTTGPNTAPKPAQAKDTMVKTELFGSRAMNIATTAIRRSVILSATMLSFWFLYPSGCFREGRKKLLKMLPEAGNLQLTW